MKKKTYYIWVWVVMLIAVALVAWIALEERGVVKPFFPRQERSGSKMSQERAAFGSIMSPDGKWRVVVRETGDYAKSVTHEIELQAVSEKNSKILLTVVEKAKNSDVENPGTSRWKVAGWSADGKSVYYVTEPVFQGGTDSGMPLPQTFGSVLYQADVESKKSVQLISLNTTSMRGQGYLDVYPQKDRVVYLLDDELFSNRLGGGDKTPLQNPGVIRAIISPSTEKIAVVVMKNLSPEKGMEEEPSVKYYYGVIDAKTGVYKQLGEGSDLRGWIDDQSFMVGEKIVKFK